MKTLLSVCVLTILFNVSAKAQAFENALHFDGVNDYVNMGSHAVFDVDSAVTYEAWINPDTTQSGVHLQ